MPTTMGVQQKPMLPPRQGGSGSNNMSVTTSSEIPPPYEYGNLTDRNPTDIPSWPARDVRTSSQHSLVPSESNVQNQRRRLLLIYVHGFMGNETSFRSFPAHVHQLLTVLLAETHVVHTKIYPRYRSRKNISFARDNFSAWLEPHEDPKTDVVLLGHSMGGLLCSEVVLKPSIPPARSPLAHRILGTINFDVPFLGMHPGVVRSGLASIFKPAEETHQDEFQSDLEPRGRQGSEASGSSDSQHGITARRSDTLWQPNLKDPNFDTPFPNDVKLPVRKGWESAWHFISKHSKDLKGATKNLVSSHMEFGGAMANYGELKSRYGRVRILEEHSADVRKSITDGIAVPARVRFINYYTASTGRPKKPKAAPEAEAKATSSEASSLTSASTSQLAAPEASEEEDRIIDPTPENSTAEMVRSGGNGDWDVAAETLTIEDPSSEMTTLEPSPVVELEDQEDSAEASAETPLGTLGISPVSTLQSTTSFSPTTLPPLPDLPPAPPPLDVSFIQDAATRKMVEKEHARATKAYEKAVKEREKSIAEWRKSEQKREKTARQAAEKAEKDAVKAELLAAKAKEQAESAKMKDASNNKKKQQDRPLTHKEKEELRLLEEKQRMEAEALRMSGRQKDEVQEEPEQSLDPGPSTISDRSGDASPSVSLHVGNETTSTGGVMQSETSAETTEVKSKPLKDRMFCSLPPKDANGQLDPCWVRIFMKDVDEVGAHCGLFFIDERYERLVGEVADRIEAWVREDIDTRAVLEAMSESLD